MSKIAIFGVLALLLGAGVVSSASGGFISQIPDMSRKAQLALAGLACLAAWAGWYYFTGGFGYIAWLWEVPARPQTEIQFVTSAQDAMNRWADGNPADQADCHRTTTALEAQAEAVTDWTGTVYTAYRIGSGIALVIRIGRSTALRTSYDEGANAVLVEPGSAAFAQAAALSAGDPVHFSGTMVPATSDCAFGPDVVDQATGSTFLFRFTQLRQG